MPGARSVLIVDDEESIRLLLGRIVESVPMVEITLAGSCEEALQLASSRAYDLILLDLLMPGIGGLEVLKAVRTASLNRATPVIIVSVMADQDTMIVCRSLGISGYIVKPIERGPLAAAIEAQLDGRGKPKSAGN